MYSFADFSFVKRELDSLDAHISERAVGLKELRRKNKVCEERERALWTHHAAQLTAISDLECGIADKKALATVYKAGLDDAERTVREAQVHDSEI